MSCAAVVCASEFNAQDFITRFESGEFDTVIAVDGGYVHLSSLNVVPSVAIGDFDSLGYIPNGVEIISYPSEKDESDYELALLRVCEQHYSKVVVFGALGGRLDHTFAALQVSSRFAQENLTIELVGLNIEAKLLYGPAQLQLDTLAPHTIVSIFSLSDMSYGVTISGFKYEATEINLSNNTSLGLSNEALGQPCSVSVKNGILCVFIQK